MIIDAEAGLYKCSRCKKMKWEDEMNIVKSPYRRKDGKVSYNSSLCKDCRSEVVRKYRESHRPQERERSRESGRKIKLEVLSHYSGIYPPLCAKCGLQDIRVLSIDHILGGGGNHRRLYGKYGNGFYRFLKKEDYPDGYQVLCMNCQFIKRHEKLEWRL